MKTCINCNNYLKRYCKKYCSVKCQLEYQHNQYILGWISGKLDGGRGKSTRNISEHIKRYLVANYGESCALCKWNKIHPITHKVPLEIDHIDGNPENNNEDNLRLICPNCHALTPNFRNLNRGRGRAWRLKYIKSVKTASAISS